MTRCLLLAAGLGERLRPWTLSTPKCLLPIRGRPLLAHWLDLLERYGFREVRVNTHHLAEQVTAFVHNYTGPLRLEAAYEPELLGSAGTLRRHRAFFPAVGPLLVAYADNLTNADLGALARAHVAAGRPLTVGLFRPDDPRRCGLVEVGGDGRMLGFEEKPAEPRGQWANAGVYAMEGCVLDALTAPDPADIARDLLPLWVGRATAVPLRGYLRDIGTPESYAAAEREWPG